MITYTFKIKTNRKLEEKFYDHLNITRCVYNLAKEVNEEYYKKGIKISEYELSKQLTELKKDFEWIKNVNAFTLQASIGRLYDSYKRFYKGAGYPKWANKKSWRSVTFKQGNIKRAKSTLRFEGNKFTLPKIGLIKVFKSREVYGNIKIARIIKKADGWYLQVITDYERPKSDSQAEVGIDLGITHFVTTSDGEFFKNIRTTERYAKQLRIEQRSLSRKKKGSNNWYKQVKRVQLLYQKIVAIRKDNSHKISDIISKEYSKVYCENLVVSDMVKNKTYAKSVLDVSWGRFIRCLEYKTNVIKVDPKNTSRECNSCGHITKENRKTQSEFKCVSCGHSGNADVEAALTILKRGQSLMYANVNH